MRRMTEEQFLRQVFHSLRKLGMNIELPIPEAPILSPNHEICNTFNISPAFELVVINLVESLGFKLDDAISAGREAVDYFLALEKGQTPPAPTLGVRSFAVSVINIVGEHVI